MLGFMRGVAVNIYVLGAGENLASDNLCSSF
jgi:hypothetical protein